MWMQNQLYRQDVETCLEYARGLEELRGLSIMIVGASGALGSFLVDALFQSNKLYGLDIKVQAVGRSMKRLRNSFAYLKKDGAFELIEHDVMNPFPSSRDCDLIVHLASNAYPEAIYEDPVGTIRANTEGAYNLLDFLRRSNGKRIVYVSTGEIYGQAIEGIDEFKEDYMGNVDLLSPRSCYPLSKRCAENLCISYGQQFGLETVIARPCHTYGPVFTAKDNRANVQFISSAARGEDIVMKSRGTQVRSYSYVADTISGLLTVMAIGRNGEAYNLASEKGITSIAGLAETVASAGGVRVDYQLRGNDQPSPFNRAVLSSEKLQSLGWRPAFSLEEGVSHSIDILKWKLNL